MSYKITIEKLLSVMQSNRLLLELDRMMQYNDDVKVIHYYAKLRYLKKNSDGNSYANSSAVSGLSLYSKEMALLKCLMEAVERYSVSVYKNDNITNGNYEQIAKLGEVLDPSSVSAGYLKSKELGWIEGVNLSENSKCFLPAQLVYLYYKKRSAESALAYPNVTTGTAAGFDFESTVLRGIYEVIERDAMMGIYLNKISAPKLDMNMFKNRYIKELIKKCERYKLELNVFDITTDLGIPTIMAVLIDRTGIGPAISIGTKTSASVEEAFLGAITEPFLTRIWLRMEMEKENIKIPKNSRGIASLLDRGLFWSSPSMIKELNFLLQQESTSFNNKKKVEKEKMSLEYVLQTLKNSGLTVYGADITAPMFQKIGCLVYKIIIPNLQPLYLNEYEKGVVLNKKRLESIQKFFGNKSGELNNIPHPFL